MDTLIHIGEEARRVFESVDQNIVATISETPEIPIKRTEPKDTGGDVQLNHSLRPTDNGDDTFNITKGTIYIGKLSATLLPSTATNIDFSTNTHFQIKADWTSDFRSPTVTWEAGTSFGTNTDLIRYFPILEFGTPGDFSTLIRRQTNDIHIENYPIPQLPESGDAALLVFNSGALEWVAPNETYDVLQLMADGKLGFDDARVK